MAAYGRPRYRVSYYSQRINAHAFQTFESRHEAIGAIVTGLSNDMMEWPILKYEPSYDNDDTEVLQYWETTWNTEQNFALEQVIR